MCIEIDEFESIYNLCVYVLRCTIVIKAQFSLYICNKSGRNYTIDINSRALLAFT